MRYSFESKYRKHVKGYGFFSCAKKFSGNLSNKFSQKLLDTAKKSLTHAIKTAWERTIQKTAKATCDLIENKIIDNITNASKKSSKELHSEKEPKNERTKERDISPEQR